MGALMLILTASLAVLAPQPSAWLGGEVLGLTFLTWLLQIGSARDSGRAARKYGRPAREHVSEIILGQAQMVPFAVGGVLLVTGAEGGLAWLAAGAVTVFVLSVVNAWVLLVEILR
jgi:modulator of FtsH protease